MREEEVSSSIPYLARDREILEIKALSVGTS